MRINALELANSSENFAVRLVKAVGKIRAL
jgi:hypothetical protein